MDLEMDVEQFREFIRTTIDDTTIDTQEKTDKIMQAVASHIASAFFLGLDADGVIIDV